MKVEIQALYSNNIWSLVPFYHSMNVVGCHWVYKIKHHVDDKIEHYKARLVARGFSQQKGIDYFETFSPDVKQVTILLIFTVAVLRVWKINQLDIHNIFLNETLNEEVYMQ
jgi:histone deacetylase 1/2